MWFIDLIRELFRDLFSRYSDCNERLIAGGMLFLFSMIAFAVVLLIMEIISPITGFSPSKGSI